MKRLLFPLLAALALPTAVNAAPTYLTCLINESRSAVIGDYESVNGKVVVVKIPNPKFKPWEKSEKDAILRFTLNEGDQKGSVLLPNGSMRKLNFVKFLPESISINNPSYGYKSYGGIDDRFEISRIDGSIFRQTFLMDGAYVLENRGTCEKSEPKNTLF